MLNKENKLAPIPKADAKATLKIGSPSLEDIHFPCTKKASAIDAFPSVSWIVPTYILNEWLHKRDDNMKNKGSTCNYPFISTILNHHTDLQKTLKITLKNIPLTKITLIQVP